TSRLAAASASACRWRRWSRASSWSPAGTPSQLPPAPGSRPAAVACAPRPRSPSPAPHWPPPPPPRSPYSPPMKSFEEAAAFIRQNEVGRRAHVETPYGRRLLCYADLTATGRYLHFVEEWIRRVRPFYANTHTSVSSTGRIMTELREQARQV